METDRGSDRACGLVFGQASGRGWGDQNSMSASEETQNRRNKTAYELEPEPVAERTSKDSDPEEA